MEDNYQLPWLPMDDADFNIDWSLSLEGDLDTR